MKLSKLNIPKEVDADVAMSVVIPNAESLMPKKLSFLYEFKGVSERTALGDNLGVGIRNKQNGTAEIRFSLKRDSLYHILPEYLFHPLDRYLGTDGDAEEFDKRYKEQEEQKSKALTYFKPFDQLYQQLRTDYQRWLNEHIFSGNQFLADFILDGYEVNRNNPYIKAVLPCIPWLRDFRGNDNMIETALGYAFKGDVDVKKMKIEKKEVMSKMIHSSIDGTISDLYCGASFCTIVWAWKAFYHTKIETVKDLKILKYQIQEFSDFFSEWFLSAESELNIDFGDREAIPYLSEINNEKGIFLNYSTQLI